MQDRPKASRRVPLLGPAIVIVLLLLMFAGGVYAVVLMSRNNSPQEGDVAQGPMVVPKPVSSGYVGNAACQECHADIVEAFAGHPMGQSLQPVGDEIAIEDYDDAEFAGRGLLRYRVEKTDSDVLHHEILLSESGETIYDQAEPVNYVLGSGQLGRSYLLERNGILTQSPIGWYTEGDRWDLSPGYKGFIHPRFQRRVGDGCLYCHSGRVNALEPNSDRYAEQTFLQHSVSCERCHGPGAEHVALHRSRGVNDDRKDEQGPDDSIINPARLAPDLRDDVCFQCHLQGEAVIPRFGRGFFDFRPGQRLEDSCVVFVGKNRIDSDGRSRAVSQVEQMRSSVCYQKSGRRMTCTSCHDPHRVPRPEERQAYFRERCLSCHQDQGCSLPEPEQAAAPANGSCIHCHMPKSPSHDVPHTGQTDHRVLRRPTDAEPFDTVLRVDIKDAVVFDGAAKRIPQREVDRARALALMEKSGRKDEALGAKVERLLLGGSQLTEDVAAGLSRLAGDGPALVALGSACRLQNRPREAIFCWEEALNYNPRDEQALTLLALHYHETGDVSSALQNVNELIELLPDAPILYGRRAHMLAQLGDLDSAVESAYQALELDPSLTQIRKWLVEVHGLRNEPEQAQRQLEIAERAEAAQAKAVEEAEK